MTRLLTAAEGRVGLWGIAEMLVCLAVTDPSCVALAHPMGNFSINHYAGLELAETEIRLRYILDMAEIPTFQEIDLLDRDRNGDITAAERERYASEKAPALAQGLGLQVNGTSLTVALLSQDLTITPGAGGLPTIKLSVLYRALMTRPLEPVEVVYEDRNYPGRAGWKEIAVAEGAGVTVIGSLFPRLGSELRSYPEDAAQSPPQVVEARFHVAPAGGRKAASSSPAGLPLPSSLGPLNDRLAALISRVPPRSPAILLSLLIAFGLGAAHALSPGHGKTIVAAYLVGSKGTARHALLLGLTVTLSHTVGVFLLGLVTLYLSKFVVPERLYPWLGFLSGLAILVMGVSLFRQRWRARGTLHEHEHEHEHEEQEPHHHEQGHDHGMPHHHSTHKDHEQGISGDGSLGRLLGLGITGGMVPCPSALVVLLSAIAFHQVAFGLLLILAFSAGIAATLVGIGLLLVYAGGVLSRMDGCQPLARAMPLVSAAAVAMLGGLIALGTWSSL